MAAKAKMFNRQASSPKSKPDEILNTLGLQPGQKIAEIGAGGGYFTFRFSEAVGKDGQVYALDTDAGKIEFMKKLVAEKKLSNISIVQVGKEGFSLPEKVDLIFMRNAYHHITDRIEYFAKIKDTLKPNGRIAIVEHKSGGKLNFHGLFEHRVNQETIVEEMNQAGYRVIKKADFLKDQSFTIFSAKE